MRISTVTQLGGASALAFAAILVSSPAAAQAAAEEAIILSGTSEATGAAARDMGGAVRSSIGGASDAIAATNARARGARSGTSSPSGTPSQSGTSYTVYWITNAVDALDKYAVPTYRMNNGAILKVSGTLRTTPDATCVRNCRAS